MGQPLCCSAADAGMWGEKLLRFASLRSAPGSPEQTEEKPTGRRERVGASMGS